MRFGHCVALGRRRRQWHSDGGVCVADDDDNGSARDTIRINKK